MAVLIKDDGTETEGVPANGKKFRLDELQRYVEGYIELVTLKDNRLMFVNEDGKYDEKIKHRPNSKATELLRAAGGMPWDIVTGNAVICKKRES